MKKIITIGSALIDVFVKSDQFHLGKGKEGTLLCSKYGDKVEVDDFLLVGGGGAGNTAVGFARQGFEVAVIAELGKDLLADLVISEQRKEGVTTNLINQEKREQTGLSVILIAPQGGRTILVHRGASCLLEKTDLNWQAVGQADWVHQANTSGQLPLLEELFRVAAERQIGVSWNPGKADIQLVASHRLPVNKLKVDLLIVNFEEWQLFGSAQSQLAERIKEIVITNGRQGGQVLQAGRQICAYQIDTRVKPVDETGAGDAFGVGYVTAHLRGKTVDEKCQLGVKNAAAVVSHLGAKTGLLRGHA